MYYTREDKYDKMEAKGLEVVRRDPCALVSVMVQEVLHRILVQRSVDKAREYVLEMIQKLLHNEVDMSLLVISKTLNTSQYQTATAQQSVQKKMQKRDMGSAPVVGDRVPYVIIKLNNSNKASENAEDPMYVLANNIPIDTDYYIHNQLEKPLLRIFDPIMENAEAVLFKGTHMLSVKREVPKGGSGMMKFVKKEETCLHCKCRSLSAGQALCAACEPNRAMYMQEAVQRVNAIQEQHSTLWRECQRCQHSDVQEIICGAQNCPIYFMRTRVERQFEAQLSAWKRLSTDF